MHVSAYPARKKRNSGKCARNSEALLSADTRSPIDVTVAEHNDGSSRRIHAIWLIPALIILFDQATKWIVVAAMELHQSVPVFGDWFRITYILNPGGAFGVRWGHQGFYFLAALLVIAWITWHLWQHGTARRLSGWALALILGGAIGNLTDRIILGQVIDFVDVEFPDMRIPAFDFGLLRHPGMYMDRWPTFNVADSAVTTGVIILIITLFYDPILRRRSLSSAPATLGGAPTGVETAPDNG
jgi:signal peptidase II